MFQFTPFPSCRLCIHLPIPGHYPRCVPAFGHPRIIRYVLLPAAFRSLSRPSSAPSAKAFTLCPYSLDLYLVLSFIEIVVSTSQLFFLKKTCLVLYFLPLCSFQFCAFYMIFSFLGSLFTFYLQTIVKCCTFGLLANHASHSWASLAQILLSYSLRS